MSAQKNGFTSVVKVEKPIVRWKAMNRRVPSSRHTRQGSRLWTLRPPQNGFWNYPHDAISVPGPICGPRYSMPGILYIGA